MTANYQTVEGTCPLVLIKVLMFGVSLKNALPCARKPKPQKFVLPETCIHLSAASHYLMSCVVAATLGVAVGHLWFTMSSPWQHAGKKEKALVCFSTETLGVKMNGLRIQVSSRPPPPPRLTLTSVPQCPYGDQTLQAPPVNMGWHSVFFGFIDFSFLHFRFVFFSPVLQQFLFFKSVHIYLPVPKYSYSELFCCLCRDELWIRQRLTCQMTSALRWRCYFLFPVSPLWQMLTLMAQMMEDIMSSDLLRRPLFGVFDIFRHGFTHPPMKKKKKDSVRKVDRGLCCRERDSTVKQNLHKVKMLFAQAEPSPLFVPPSPPCLPFQVCASWRALPSVHVCIRTRNASILHLSMAQSRGLVSPVADSCSPWPPASSSVSVLLVFGDVGL